MAHIANLCGLAPIPSVLTNEAELNDGNLLTNLQDYRPALHCTEMLLRHCEGLRIRAKKAVDKFQPTWPRKMATEPASKPRQA